MYKLILFLFGLLLMFLGRRFIIMHWPYAKVIFYSGLVLSVVIVVGFIYRTAKRYK